MSCDEKWNCEKWSCDQLWCDELWDEAARREQERRDPSEKQEPHTVMWGIICVYAATRKQNASDFFTMFGMFFKKQILGVDSSCVALCTRMYIYIYICTFLFS